MIINGDGRPICTEMRPGNTADARFCCRWSTVCANASISGGSASSAFAKAGAIPPIAATRVEHRAERQTRPRLRDRSPQARRRGPLRRPLRAAHQSQKQPLHTVLRYQVEELFRCAEAILKTRRSVLFKPAAQAGVSTTNNAGLIRQTPSHLCMNRICNEIAC